jgi:hypothetical protein
MNSIFASRNQTVLGGASEIGPIDAEHRDLEGVTRLDSLGEHHAI